MRVVVRILKKIKILLIIVIAAVYFGFAIPANCVYAASEQNAKQETEQLQEEETETTTIEEEPTAEAATMEQNRLIFQTQIMIIGLGIIMAAAGTYVFVFKKTK